MRQKMNRPQCDIEAVVRNPQLGNSDLVPCQRRERAGPLHNLAARPMDNRQLVEVNEVIREHSIEVVGRKLRGYMTGMKAIV